MNYKIEASPSFLREAKRLKKKYRSLKDELTELYSLLEINPTLGVPLGNDIYKIRLAVASRNKGKSGGTRVMSYVKILDNTVVLFYIYSKSEKDSLSENEINKLLQAYL